MPRARCLHRSLTLHSWLRHQGFPSELRIGVIKDGAELHTTVAVMVTGWHAV